MSSSECRLEARNNLNGKWGKVACFSLAYFIIFFAINLVKGFFPEFLNAIISLAMVIIELPLSFGLIIAFFKLYLGEEVNAFDFLSLGFSNFAKAWKISLRIFLKMIIPVILVYISYVIIAFGTVSVFYRSSSSNYLIITIIGFILLIFSMIWATTKSYYYQLAYLVAIDDDSLSAKESVEKSQELMTGHRGSLFLLQLSFIGWAILAIFTLGIGYLWLVPYIQFATIVFYKKLSENNSNTYEENNNPIN